MCFIRSCHGEHAWIHCPKLKDIRAQRGKDWSPSAADREAALLIAENKALRVRLAHSEGRDEAGASVARAGLTAASGVSLAPGPSQGGAQGPPTTSTSLGDCALDMVPRPVRLGPRIRLEYVGDSCRDSARREGHPPDEGGGPPVL